MRYRSSEIKRKILILLLGGLALGLNRSYKRHFKIIREMAEEWKTEPAVVKRTIGSLRRYGMIKEVLNADGTVDVVLTDLGRNKAEKFKLENLKIQKQAKWDGNWRVVIFDVPERIKETRNAIRFHLRRLDFYELQKSVFVCPFPCADEVGKIVAYYKAENYVRIIMSHSIDIEEELKRRFKI